MIDILSTLKGEYSRTLVLIVIPGAIALQPFAVIIYDHCNPTKIFISQLLIYASILYLISSIFIGFVIQDIGARIELFLDRIYCKNPKEYEAYQDRFTSYLFNKREEEYIVTHYYRAMLIRLKFELHTVVAILFYWLAMIAKFALLNYKIDWNKTISLLIISFCTLIYLLWEASKGVETLDDYRKLINQKFKPTSLKK